MSALICLIAKTEELTNQVLRLRGPAAQAVLSLIQEVQTASNFPDVVCWY